MSQDDFKPKTGGMRDAGRARPLRHTSRVFRQAGKAGIRALWQRGHISPSAFKRGMGAGVRAAAGLIAPGSRRVIVKARYTRIIGADLGAARAHIKYILRDGVTRKGAPGHLYDASHDESDGSAFLDRSEGDPHQFRFIVSAEDSARLADLKPFVRDLLFQMERDLETKLDWVAVDHFNTGHPHTHIVIRGRDDQGRDLVMARDYIAHGVRARAQGLITLELGPETDLERVQKLFNEAGQERLTRLDRSLLARAKDGILVITTAEEQDPVQQTLRIGRLKTLERLGLAQERQQGVWELDGHLEGKLRRLGERADKFRTMQQVLKELGIDRSAAAMALFERGPRKVPLIGKVIGVGMVDEITDRIWVVVDAVDGRLHYADLGRLRGDDLPQRGMLVALAGDETLRGRPTSVPRLAVLSVVELNRLATYDGPTWLDDAIIGKFQVQSETAGFVAELRQALAERELADISGLHEVAPKPEMMRNLRQRDTVAPAQHHPRTARTRKPGLGRLRARHHDADGQASRHPARGHLHPGALEAGDRTPARAGGHGPHRPQPGHVDPRSRSHPAWARMRTRHPRTHRALQCKPVSAGLVQQRKPTMNDSNAPSSPAEPPQPARNKGKLTGPKPPLRPGHVWSIRAKLQLERRTRDLALFNLAIDSKLRGCDLVALRVDDVAPNGYAVDRATVRQSKTGRPVRFELTEVTRQSLDDYLRATGRKPGQCLFPGRRGPDQHLTTRQYARLVSEWVSGIGLDPLKYATHSMRRTKATLIYRRTGNLRAVQLLLGHQKIESTVRYLGVEVDDAIEIAEKTDV